MTGTIYPLRGRPSVIIYRLAVVLRPLLDQRGKFSSSARQHGWVPRSRGGSLLPAQSNGFSEGQQGKQALRGHLNRGKRGTPATRRLTKYWVLASQQLPWVAHEALLAPNSGSSTFCRVTPMTSCPSEASNLARRASTAHMREMSCISVRGIPWWPHTATTRSSAIRLSIGLLSASMAIDGAG